MQLSREDIRVDRSGCCLSAGLTDLGFDKQGIHYRKLALAESMRHEWKLEVVISRIPNVGNLVEKTRQLLPIFQHGAVLQRTSDPPAFSCANGLEIFLEKR